ncbi:TlpA family protein disulfide reductase [Allorhodopirellula heiligendammensis]|uniref:Thiol-disulfide oxidoreductase n=1 Tax=Allorhodopirellula heiligendammensis TaxID=2714739 RepID=A0A5C6BET4_9BACT|nr:TlpA disulfide reductase family protein [Allorhodopirellula heiligendammensis]TWU10685.1 thiol-disulfide oxidoreductase [Allorhodopirellula heiligendammensis]
MDRSMKNFLVAAALPLALSLAVGCGGSTPSESSPEDSVSTGLDDLTPAPPSMPGQDDPPAEPVNPGMMLPDDVPLPDPSEINEPRESNGEKPKGMELPDDIQPVQTSSTAAGESLGMIVGTQTKSEDAAEVKLNIQLAPWQEIDAVTKQAGRITVVDFWSLSCVPCLREYPQLVALQKKYPDRVRAIGVNVDFYGGEKYPPKSYQPQITKFLTAVHATFPNYISQTPSEDVFKSVKINALPAVLVLDEQGTVVERFTDASHSGGFTYEDDIVPLVEKLIAK